MRRIGSLLFFTWFIFFVKAQNFRPLVERVPAVRIVRFQVDYPNAEIHRINHYTKWTSLMRKSVLASLRFIDKHWRICAKSDDVGPNKKELDCGKLQVTGEIVRENYYRINATFIAEK